MTRYFLTGLIIEGFRGINNESNPLELRFQPNAVNSVFAINGVGKSSIFEALSYAIRGFVPKLEVLQAQERPEDYICNRFHSKRKGTIEIELTPDDGNQPVTVLVERDAAGIRTVTSPSGYLDPTNLLDMLNEDFTLLDYHTFIRFIDSTPLDRGRSFSALLGLSSYSDLRQALQTVSDTRTVKSDFELTALQTQAENALEAMKREQYQWVAAYHGATGKQATDTAKINEYNNDILLALAGIDLIKEIVSGKLMTQLNFDDIKAKIREAEGGEKRKQLESAIAKITKLDGLGDPDLKTAAEQIKIQTLIKERDDLFKSTRGDLFQKLHESAKSLIDAAEWEDAYKCPVCGSAPLPQEISLLIKVQLDQYAKVAAKTEEIKIYWQSSAWVRRLALLEQTEIMEVPRNDWLSIKLAQKTSSGRFTLIEVNNAIIALTELERKRTDQQVSAKKLKEELERELPPSLVKLTEQIEYARQFSEAIIAFFEKSRAYTTAYENLQLRKRWQAFISKAATVFGEAEAELSQSKITEIDAEYKSMFERIMAVQDVVPKLERADRSQDLHVQLSDFHGHPEVSARALLSESFRNALAVSVFLSAALKHSGVPRFLILDDVTSSFDSGHQWNLMEFIRQHLQQPVNPDGLQFIIFSHDGLLEKYFDKLGSTTGWNHQKLQGWPPRGAVMSQHQGTNRLRTTAENLLNAGQVKAAEPLIRQYLEYKLLQVIRKCNIPVPLDFSIKDHLKMVSNCTEAINTAVDLHKLAGNLVLDTGQVSALVNIHMPTLIGNWITHYETGSGSSLSPSMLKSVLKTIDEYADCFKCTDTSCTRGRNRCWYKSLSVRC